MPAFTMPSLGADMDAGTLVEWLVQPGQPVRRGDVVAVVESQKGAVDVEIWQDGVIDALVVPAGSKVPVGAVLATLRDGHAAPTLPASPTPVPPNPSASVAAPAVVPPVLPAPPAPVAAATAGPVVAPARPRASPAARRRARELSVDLAAVHGAGSTGPITSADVERAAAARSAAAAPVEALAVAAAPSTPAATAAPARDASSELRRAIAAAMARSKREIPHYYLETSIDLAAALAFLEDENRRLSVAERILPAVLLLKAVAHAARAVPALNGFWRDGGFVPATSVHLGVAVALRGGGLVAPALHDADTLPLPALMQAFADLIRRTRSGRLRSSELADPTLTVTSLGDQGVETVFGVIYPPQVALCGFGRITERPWAAGGLLGVRPAVTATLAADHRASDGHQGALFLRAVADALAHPETLR